MLLLKMKAQWQCEKGWKVLCSPELSLENALILRIAERMSYIFLLKVFMHLKPWKKIAILCIMKCKSYRGIEYQGNAFSISTLCHVTYSNYALCIFLILHLNTNWFSWQMYYLPFFYKKLNLLTMACFILFAQRRKENNLTWAAQQRVKNISTEWHKSIHNAAHVDPIQ